MEVSEEKVKKKEAQNLSKQEENINLHICEAQQIPIRINFKTSISRHILDRMLTANDNQIRFIDTVPEELQMEVCDIVQEAVIKIIAKKKKTIEIKLGSQILDITDKDYKTPIINMLKE